MTELLYMDDSYIKEFEAKVVEILENGVVLDKTAFNPRGGGLVSDTGYLYANNSKYNVIEVYKDKETGKIVHKLDKTDGLNVGDTVHGYIDWERRYRIMRMHTGLHILISLFNKKTGVLVTGNQVAPEKSRVDLNLDNPDKKLIQEFFAEANEIIKKNLPVKIYYLKREEAFTIPGIVKLAKAFPPSVDKLRIVEIEGVDIQADGGPHVSNTSEIGELVFLKFENKGKNNRRIYFTVKP